MTSATTIGPPIPHGHELCARLASGRDGELSEERSRAERGGKPPVMRCRPQRPHMHVELVGKDLKRHPIMRWRFRLQRLRLADDRLWRGPSTSVPRSECFYRDPKGRRALRPGQA
jgi:hypothetical protein